MTNIMVTTIMITNTMITTIMITTTMGRMRREDRVRNLSLESRTTSRTILVKTSSTPLSGYGWLPLEPS